MATARCVITLSCPDRIGVVHRVSGFLVERECNIVQSQQYSDPSSGQFFLRVQFDSALDAATLSEEFNSIALEFTMTWQLHDVRVPMPSLILVSRQLHCLNDLLFRTSTGGLPIDVAAIVSNHRDAEPLAQAHRIPFHHVPITAATRGPAEARLSELIEATGAELLVLARYMQLVPETICARLPVINIHHSFLPSFKGARPYHQAHARGVKLVGATAHYATADLDEGPIIEQDVIRVDHDQDAAALAALGADVEAQVLARAVRWHAEHRVLRNSNRTVVFR